MWNYRIVKVEEEDTLAIQEVYYDANGLPLGHCDATVAGETVEELQDVLTMMASALKKPVLKKSNFKGKKND